MNGELVGHWYRNRIGTEFFQYEPSWAQSRHSRALSLSLPLPAGNAALQGPAVGYYFDNLLPESRAIRERVQRRYGVPSLDAFDLLTAIGRDCVGAVQLLPPDVVPEGIHTIRGKPLTEDGIAQLLRETTGGTGVGRSASNEFRISLAGMQEKTALLREDGHWMQPSGTTPTTHILKLPMGGPPAYQYDLTDSVANEWVCLQLLAALGMPVATAMMGSFGGQEVLVVERFDRQRLARSVRSNEPWIARLPQEDFCQATGTPALRKYEVDGGPSVKACLDVLAGSSRADQDRTTFLLSQFAFWLMAAIDGHGKNFSIALRPGNQYHLTPLYDVLSAWPIIGEAPGKLSLHKASLAMAVRSKNAHYKLLDIQPRHWRTLADKSGAPDTFEAMVMMAEAVAGALDRVGGELPEGFPMKVWNSLSTGMAQQAERFRRGLQDA
jgi:serine/threonine-protein kinase HipA